MTWLTILRSKALQWLAIAGGFLLLMSMYGARKKQEGQKEVITKIEQSTKRLDDEIAKINRQPLDGGIGDWVHKSKTDSHL